VSGGVIATVAGNGAYGFSGDGGPATNAQLYGPSGVAVDTAGNVYIADSGNFRIRKVSGGVIATVAGNGAPGFSGDGGPATNAELNYQLGVAVDSAGNLYIADSIDCRIRKVSGGVIATVAGTTLGFSGDGALATSAQLQFPEGVAVDSAGNFYIADTGNFRVRKVLASSGIISTIAGNGLHWYSGDGGQAINAQLNSPSDIAVDNAGNLYVTDSGNSRVRVVSPGGTITTFAGGGTQGLGDGGPATSASLSRPGALATDSAGNVYIRDVGNGLLRKVSGGVINSIAAISTIQTTASNGTFAFSGDGGVAVDSSFNVYDSEFSSGLVYKFMAPATPWHNDSPVTVGVKVRSDMSGAVTGIRFFKGAGNNGSHTGLLYSYSSGTDSGTLLATAAFTGETDSGWQTVSFSTPVAIQANTTYVAAYWSNSGYADDAGYFSNKGVSEAHVQLLQAGVDGPNGVYAYGSSPQFPSSSSGSANYWVDVVFSTVALPPQSTQAVSVSPSSGSGDSQTFTLVYTDTSGATDLASAQVIIDATNSVASSCYVWVTPASGAVWLANDNGTSWPAAMTLGTGGTQQNSQCTLNVAASSGTLSGNTYTLQLAISFQAGFAGGKNVYGYASTQAGLNSGWQSLGIWTVPVVFPPQASSVSPSSGSGASQTFTFVYTDLNGAQDLASAQALSTPAIAAYLHATCG
jgi:sugar lactone lactonase YvrE